MSVRKFEAVSATFPPELLVEIDARAAALDMTRSQYLRSLARRDILSASPNPPQPETREGEEHKQAA